MIYSFIVTFLQILLNNDFKMQIIFIIEILRR